MQTLAEAMQAAHARGIIHRDLKPSNVLFSSPLPPGGEGPGVNEASAALNDGHWFPARFHYRQVALKRPDDSRNQYYLGLSHLGNNDPATYRQTCAQMLERFAHTENADTAWAVAFLATLLSDAVKDPGPLVKLAELAVAQKPDSHDYLETLGAALYRAGRFADAVKRLDQAVEKQANGGTIWMQLFLAMSHHQLKRPDQAKDWLGKAVQQIEATENPPPANRLRWSFLRRDAEALILGKRE